MVFYELSIFVTHEMKWNDMVVSCLKDGSLDIMRRAEEIIIWGKWDNAKDDGNHGIKSNPKHYGEIINIQPEFQVVDLGMYFSGNVFAYIQETWVWWLVILKINGLLRSSNDSLYFA